MSKSGVLWFPGISEDILRDASDDAVADGRAEAAALLEKFVNEQVRREREKMRAELGGEEMLRVGTLRKTALRKTDENGWYVGKAHGVGMWSPDGEGVVIHETRCGHYARGMRRLLKSDVDPEDLCKVCWPVGRVD
jgi:hypothetical protein